jgi:hypothetical protein
MALIGFFAFISKFNHRAHILIPGALIILFVSIFLIYGLFVLARLGIFARYKVLINKNHVIVFDKRDDLEILKTPFNTDNFYIAKTRQQVGNVSTELSALCYGNSKQIFVEDVKPGKELILLCSGKNDKIENLKIKIISILNSSF